MKYRIEKDTMGEIQVDDSKSWGAQTQRSIMNFPIGTETMPAEIIKAFAILKMACAMSNYKIGKLSENRAAIIEEVCREIIDGKHNCEFPLKIWQTGSGTQTNMNVNEVISHIGNKKAGEKLLHPNDHVNMSQSSNDTFPTAMNVAAVLEVANNLLPAIDGLIGTFDKLERSNDDIIKIGRTHLQDATPIKFSQEISGWKEMLCENKKMVEASLVHLRQLAIGGTAVGTGLNAPAGFDVMTSGFISEITGMEFVPARNKFHALTSKDAFVFAHGALKALAANMMKIANDIRWLASGPRCGIGEISIPENEPGSSIMPGKVNPTQCESVTMVACQVMGNDATIGIAASQGNFQLNVFMPVCAYNFLQSVRLLSDSLNTFNKNCACGIKANKEKMSYNLYNSLMLVTCLSPSIGYDNAALVAKTAFKNNKTLRETVEALGIMSGEEFDKIVKPEKMV